MTEHKEQKHTTFFYKEDALLNLIAALEGIHTKVDFLSELSSQDFLPSNYKLQSYYDRMEATEDQETLNELITSLGTYASKEELLRDMHYHDVIRKRLDHFRSIVSELVQEMKSSGDALRSLENSRFVRHIALLSKISYVQLQVLTREYQTVIERLKQQLEALKDFLKVEFNSLDVYWFSNVSLFEVVGETVCKKLYSFIELLYSEERYHDRTKGIFAYLEKLYPADSREHRVYHRVVELSSEGTALSAIVAKVLNEERFS